MNTLVKDHGLLTAFEGMDPATLPVTDYIPDSVTLMRRELSLITERLLMAAGCPQGMWPGARDYVLEVVAVAGVAALEQLERVLVSRDGQAAWAASWLESESTLRCENEAMLLIGETVVNAALAYFTDEPNGEFLVTGLSSVVGHEGLAVRAAYHGYRFTVQTDADAGELRIRADRVERDAQSDIVQLLKHGIAVEGHLWWRLYQPSNYALSVDTDQSRLHTGVSETLLHYTV